MSHQKVTEELALGERLSIINLVDSLLCEAEEKLASDIHIDPTSTHIRIRFRIDGVLQDIHEFPKIILPEVISRVKVLSRLRTDDHHGTHDGRFEFRNFTNTAPIDVRVSIVPTHYGESCVLRLLSTKSENFTLETLGFSEHDISIVKNALQRTSGMILATGPTGSGKTTTLYTLLKLLNRKETAIITIEDPIEYAIAGIKQIQVNSKIGLSFAHTLRGVLRQDPNIIMVGEIRDSETAHIAVNTALTGHLLLSTIHTNDAATTLPRLLDMGIEPFLIASTVRIIIGQRLVRKLCDRCKKSIEVNEETKSVFIQKYICENLDAVFKAGDGCELCSGSGYLGRVSIHEVLVVTDEIRNAIVRKFSASQILAISKREGMITMYEDGLSKVIQGITTLEEVLRVIHE